MAASIAVTISAEQPRFGTFAHHETFTAYAYFNSDMATAIIDALQSELQFSNQSEFDNELAEHLYLYDDSSENLYQQFLDALRNSNVPALRELFDALPEAPFIFANGARATELFVDYSG